MHIRELAGKTIKKAEAAGRHILITFTDDTELITDMIYDADGNPLLML